MPVYELKRSSNTSAGNVAQQKKTRNSMGQRASARGQLQMQERGAYALDVTGNNKKLFELLLKAGVAFGISQESCELFLCHGSKE